MIGSAEEHRFLCFFILEGIFMMKRSLCFLLCLAVLFSLWSCNSSLTAPDADAPQGETEKAKTAEGAAETEKIRFEYEPAGLKIVENPFPNLDLTGMTQVQKAVVVTAESLFLRGSRIQYEDTRFLNTTKLSYYRWAVGQRSPEEYTSQNLGFLHCAAFCYEVYRNALDLELIYGNRVCYYTSRFDSDADKILYETPASSGFSTLTEAQLEQKKQEFLSALQPGDIIVYRVKTNGHAMLYVGNGTILHSSGSVYDWKGKKEVFEEKGTVRKDSVDFLFDKGTSRYLFNKQSYCIVRPIKDFGITSVPQKSLDRIGAMRGVLAEKLSSHTRGQTVSPGESLTFTFSLQNMTKEEKTVEITDTLPLYTEYVSGDLIRSENSLSATVTLPPESKKEMSYTLRVLKDAPCGKTVVSESFVASIPVNAPEIVIGNTLEEKEQTLIRKTAEDFSSSDLWGIELANAIYEKALGYKPFQTDSTEEIFEDLFRYYSDGLENQTASFDSSWTKTWRSPDPNSSYSNMLAPHLYGGRNVAENSSKTPYTDLEWFRVARTRYISANLLIPGDIILLWKTGNAEANPYLYTGDALLDLQINVRTCPEPFLSSLVAEPYFVVLRPSLAQ